MIKCDSCAQCVHGRPEGGWPGEASTWVADCRDYTEVRIVPFAGYKDFDECVSKNQDKANLEAYCGAIKAKAENEGGMDMAELEGKITRMFNAPIGAANDKLVATGDGGLIIKDIVWLAEGTWTDSLVGTPLHYPAKTLEEGAPNWIGTGIWTRHPGGKPRAISDKIGVVQNMHYSSEHRGVVSDGFLHGRTQASRDVIELVKAGLVTDVSSEVGGKEVWNAEAKRYEAASLAFYGGAFVDVGACKTCKLPRLNEETHECESEKTKEGEDMGEEIKTQELEKKVADLESEKAEKDKELAALMEKSQADEKARNDRVAELEKLLAEKDARVKELEKKPAPPKTLTGESAVEGDKELAAPPIKVRIHGGEISRA